MLMRIVLVFGLGLVVLAGGAAGWQYWQNLPQTTSAAEVADVNVPTAIAPQLGVKGKISQADAPQQNWLISPGGGLVDRGSLRAWLKQDRFVDERSAQIVMTAPLTALLGEGEQLPGPAYRQVFADIRAKALTPDLCAPLTSAFAAACAVEAATAPKGSLDETGENAEFAISLVYALHPEAEPLPDLSTRVLRSDVIMIDAQANPDHAATPRDFFAHVVAMAPTACPKGSTHCRVTGLVIRWEAPGKASARATVGWLAPLPAGMYPAPPLPTMPES